MCGNEKETANQIERFRDEVYQFYHQHGRSFPWRDTDDPFEILVSEFMLQQTPTGRVKKKYGPFLERFPTCDALAEASMRDVLRVWQGLGYNRRAQWLHRSAQQITSQHEGQVPRTKEQLTSLPGVGPATAGGVLAFAFHIPTVFLETNIRRACIHFFFPDGGEVEDRQLYPILRKALDEDDPRRWYYALMDYGAELKEAHPELHRRSAQYRSQAPFQGSNRQIRGAILRLLLNQPRATERYIADECDADGERVKGILQDLEKERMVCEESGRYHLP